MMSTHRCTLCGAGWTTGHACHESRQDELTRLRAEVEALKLQRTAADIVGRETANIVLLQVGEIGLLRDALENVRLLAARHRKEEWAGHMLRFCAEAGVKPSPFRGALQGDKP